MDTGAWWRGAVCLRPALGLGTIAMLAPENKNVCVFYGLCLMFFFFSFVCVSFFFYVPDLLTLSDRLSVLEALRDAGSPVAWRSRP